MCVGRVENEKMSYPPGLLSEPFPDPVLELLVVLVLVLPVSLA